MTRKCALIGLALLAVGATRCASNVSIQRIAGPSPDAGPVSGPVFVMTPEVDTHAVRGNVGRDFTAVRNVVRDRTLTIVRERYPSAEAIEPGSAPVAAIPGYRAALRGETITTTELSAARLAYDRGATHLLVPCITEWRTMRTDDPIGAFVGRHNEVAVTVRLVRLEPPALVGRVIFTSHARLTLNQPPDRLLDDRYRTAVIGLL